MRLSEIVLEQAIVPALKASTREDVLAEMLGALVSAGAADESLKAELLAKLIERESKSSTGFGRGVAVPHVKHTAVRRVCAAVGLSPRGVDFSALDKQPVYSVFMLLSPADRPEEHLQAMEAIFKNLSKDTFRRVLRQAGSVAEVVTLLDEADAQQFAG